ncbi:MAG TPA: hypothetical protein VGH97_11830 [Thermoanaerobaculia bacterium]
MKRVGPILRQVAVVAFLLFTAYAGIVDGIDSSRSASGGGQRIASVCQLLYGGLATAALLGLLIRGRWILPLVIAWGAALSVTGGLAAVVWGGQSAVVGVFAGLCTAGIAALVVWACRRHNVGVLLRRRAEAAVGDPAA